MPVRAESSQEVLDLIRSDPSFKARVQADPAAAIAEVAATPLQSDVWIYRMVVAGLLLVVLGALGGGIALFSMKGSVPDLIVAFGSAALGGLTALLIPAPSQRR